MLAIPADAVLQEGFFLVKVLAVQPIQADERCRFTGQAFYDAPAKAAIVTSFRIIGKAAAEAMLQASDQGQACLRPGRQVLVNQV